MPSAPIDEGNEKMISNQKPIGTSRSEALVSSTTTFKPEHQGVDLDSVPKVRYDLSKTSHHDASTPHTLLHSHQTRCFSCPASPTSFSKGEADMLDKQLELSCPTMSAIVKKEEKSQHQKESNPNGTSDDTYLNAVKDRQPPWLQNNKGLFNQIVDEPSTFRDFHKSRKCSSRAGRSTFRAKDPNPWRSQSLDSNIRFKKPECTCLVSRNQKSFVHPRSNDDNEPKAILQSVQKTDRTYNPQDEQGYVSHIQVPKLVVQETWTGKECPSEIFESIHRKKSGIEATLSDVAVSCVSKQSISKWVSGGKQFEGADAAVFNFQEFLTTLGIGSDLVVLTCFGTTRRGIRCTNHLSKPTRSEVQRILRGLTSIDLHESNKKFLDQLELLAYLMLCKRDHQQFQATTLTNKWKEKLASIFSTNINPNTVETILRRDESSIQSTELDHEQKTQVYDSMDIFTAFGTGFKERYTIRSFIPFDPIARSKASVVEFLRGALLRDLTKREITQSGFIYIYWFPGNFGYLKIGVTTRPVEYRLREWEKQCGHHPHLVYPELEIDRQPVPHIFRVEALVQAELRNCRKTEVRCKKCGAKHKEWFEKSSGDAVAAVKKWSAWMKEAPYVEETISEWDKKSQTTVNRSRWKLKRDLLPDIQALCEPTLETSSPQSSSPQHPRPRKGRSSTDTIARRNQSRSKSPRFTRSMALKERSKSEAPRDISDFPHFSDDFLKAYPNK